MALRKRPPGKKTSRGGQKRLLPSLRERFVKRFSGRKIRVTFVCGEGMVMSIFGKKLFEEFLQKQGLLGMFKVDSAPRKDVSFFWDSYKGSDIVVTMYPEEASALRAGVSDKSLDRKLISLSGKKTLGDKIEAENLLSDIFDRLSKRRRA